MTKPPRRRARAAARRAQRGIALIIVLWITIMLTVIAGGFAFAMRSEAMSARNALSLAQARAAANGAVERMAFELARPRYPAAWLADGQPRAWRDGDVQIVASAVDESAKIDLNSAPDTLLKGLIEKVGGADPEATARIVDAIQDWRDTDDVRRPNGAEDADYRMAGLKQKPANMPFETVSELARVLGMTPGDLRARRRQRHRELAAARHQRDDGVARRAARAAERDARGRRRLPRSSAPRRWRRSCRCLPFPPASGFGAGAVPVWRIRAEARVPDGVTFAREAVVRPSGDARRPLLTLSWQDGVTVPAPAALAPARARRTTRQQTRQWPNVN